MTGALGVELGPRPASFWARTVKVWLVPLVSPVTVHPMLAGVELQVWPPGLETTA